MLEHARIEEDARSAVHLVGLNLQLLPFLWSEPSRLRFATCSDGRVLRIDLRLRAVIVSYGQYTDRVLQAE
jgi:hypothetical protein